MELENEDQILERANYTHMSLEGMMDTIKRYRGAAMDLVDDYETRGEDCAPHYWRASAVYGHLYQAYRHLQAAGEELENAIKRLREEPK